MKIEDVYHAALCAQLVSLEARFNALIEYPLNTGFQLEARVTMKQIEAVKRAIDENAPVKNGE